MVLQALTLVSKALLLYPGRPASDLLPSLASSGCFSSRLTSRCLPLGSISMPLAHESYCVEVAFRHRGCSEINWYSTASHTS